MANFAYRAVDAKGAGVDGMMAAPDERTLESKLAEIGLTLIRASEREEAAESRLALRRQIKRRDLVDFFLQSRALLAAGVNLLDVLKTMGGETVNARLRRVIGDLTRNVEAGYPVSDAMVNHPAVFPTQLISMVRAGEHSGKMPETFQEIQRYLDWLDKLMADIKQATIYPLAVSIMLVLFVTVLFTFVAPRFIDVLVSLKVPLPLPTIILMEVSGLFVKTWWMILLALILIPIAARTLRKRWDAFALTYDRMKLALPVFGPLNHMFMMSRFAQTFAMLFHAGVPLLQSLELCRGVVGNVTLEKALGETAAEVAEGIQISDSLRSKGVFSPLLLRMVKVGEQTGDIGEAVSHVAAYYNEEIPRRVKRMFAVIEPAIILSLVMIVGMTALAIFLPIVRLMEGIR